ncbi:MAG: hypothetical protein ACRDN1_20785 [Trebonia sp.]
MPSPSASIAADGWMSSSWCRCCPPAALVSSCGRSDFLLLGGETAESGIPRGE